jgi:thiol:disulfide interchange protein
MHTAIIFFGLVLLALMLYIGERIGFSRQTMAYSFAALWLALTVINGAVGVVHTKQPLGSEIAIGSAVITSTYLLLLTVFKIFKRPHSVRDTYEGS